MLNTLNEQLAEVKGKLRRQAKLRKACAEIDQQLAQEQAHLAELEATLLKEEADVEKLERLSLKGLFYAVLGSKDEQMDKERQEALRARLQYKRGRGTVSTLQKELADFERERDQYGDLASQYQHLLSEKKRVLEEAGHESIQHILALSEQLAGAQSEKHEMEEAIQAGKELVAGLGEAVVLLESAKGWGTWDLVGGGVVATAIKHAKIDEARTKIEQVQHLLARFQRELADLNLHEGLAVEIGEFDTFADYFFDNLIFDWVVQSKIQNALKHVVTVQERVQDIITHLQEEQKRVAEKAETLRQKRLAVLEAAG